MATYHGYVLSWAGFDHGGGANRPTNAKFLIEKLTQLESIQRANSDSDVRVQGWNQLYFMSSVPLRGEEPSDSNDTVWPYLFLLRINEVTNNVIIGTHSNDITEELVRFLNTNLRPHFRSVAIHVDKLADHLLSSPSQEAGIEMDETVSPSNSPEFAITSLILDVPKYGSALRTVMLFGDDIADAEAMTTEIIGYNARQIGLRQLNSSLESARLGSNGYVRFYDTRLNGVEQCLAFVKRLDLYVT